MRFMTRLSAALLMLLAFAHGPAVRAQDDKDAGAQGECPAPVYKLAEVTIKPRIRSKPEPRYTEEARRAGVSGNVVVEAVLCATGKVTDVVVIKGLPEGLSESAVRAARRIRFDPGKKDDEIVSVRVRVVYGFSLY